jgi:hypothetical protein
MDWRGVYIGFETILSLAMIHPYEEVVNEKVAELRKANVNMLWITNGPETVQEWRTLVTTAKKANMVVMAGRGSWYISDTNAEVPEIVDRQFNNLKTIHDGLLPTERPMAWVLADEPTTPLAMTRLGELALKCHQAGIPTAAVTVPGYFKAMAQAAPSLTFFAGDPYVFFAPGLDSNPPQGISTWITYWRLLNEIRTACPRGATPITINQAFQSWRGPARLEADGTVTLLPGASQLHRAPTYWEVRWQHLLSQLAGMKGIVYFAYGGAGAFVPDPNAAPVQASNTLTVEQRTGATATLVAWPSYRKGEAWKALAHSFGGVP